MSEFREIQLEVQPELFITVARELGAEVIENAVPRCYAVNFICDYVIRDGGVEFGIKDGKICFDSMHSEIVAKYVDRYVRKVFELAGVRFRRIETNNYYVYIVS